MVGGGARVGARGAAAAVGRRVPRVPARARLHRALRRAHTLPAPHTPALSRRGAAHAAGRAGNNHQMSLSHAHAGRRAASRSHVHTHTHTHTYSLLTPLALSVSVARTRTYSYTYAHASTHTCVQVHVRIHICIYTHEYSCQMVGHWLKGKDLHLNSDDYLAIIALRFIVNYFSLLFYTRILTFKPSTYVYVHIHAYKQTHINSNAHIYTILT